MEFRYHCFVIRHASERVTVVPLELPEFTIHATSAERAIEDLELAIDDRITRSHPGRIALFARSTPGTLLALDVPALPVWGASETSMRSLRFTAVVSPAHKPFVEVRIPRLDLRLWLVNGSDLTARVCEMVRTHVLTLSQSERLRARAEGPESIEPITVRARPVKLASLKPKELYLDERPPVRPDDDVSDDDTPVGDESDDDSDEAIHVADSWDDHARPEAPKPKRAAMPTLRRLGVALHEAAKRGELDRAFERDDLVDAIVSRVDIDRPEPLVLVGEAGVGKTALLHEVVMRMAARDAPERQRDRPTFHLDGSRWIAGEGFSGDWQAQVLNVLAEARKGHAVLHLGHIADLLDAGKSAHSDQNVSQLLGPVLAAREIGLLGEATAEEWARIEQRNASFARAWSVLRIEEPSRESTERILALTAGAIAKRHALRIAPGTVHAIAALARRFWPYGSAVGNSVSLLRRFLEASAHARRTKLAPADAIDHFSGESGIPRVLLRDDLPLDPSGVRTFLTQRVIAQTHAVERVTEVVSVIKAGLSDVRRPIGVLFFAGPTGVGKTELSKALAEFVFGARDRLVRLDMGEYAGPDALARLLGEGDGGQSGALAASVRRQPFSLVLLDEIEKAHPAVFDALLGVLGEGRLTDAAGRFTDFRNTVIVMTSNLGADTLRARVGFGAAESANQGEAMRRHYVAEAERFFRPELFNRIDDFIVFTPLGADAIRLIVEREVARITDREGFRRHDLLLEVSRTGYDSLAARGLDPRYGARPLKRALERDLVVPIANHLASHRDAGAIRIHIDGDGSRVSMRTESIASGTAGITGERIRTLLARAGTLRGEIRQWWRSRLVTDLRHRVAFFDKASREASFWRERALAEDSSHRAAAARELLDALANLGRQAEATEDLAFEAFYERAEASVEGLHDEIASLQSQLAPLETRIYAALFPPRASALLYFSGARNTGSWVRWLLDAYVRWAESHSLRTHIFTCRYVSPRERPGTPKDSVAHAWKWESRRPEDNESPNPLCVALAIGGGPEALLLAAEHGVHRIQEGSTTALVRVRFEPQTQTITRAAQLMPPVQIEGAMPQKEIRRISPAKALIFDARLKRDFELRNGQLDLSELLGAYVTHRVFGVEDETWI